VEGAANEANFVDEVEKNRAESHDRSYSVAADNERSVAFGSLCSLYEGKGLSSSNKGSRGQDARGAKRRVDSSSRKEGRKEKEEGRERAQGVTGAGNRWTENEEDEQEAVAQYQAHKVEQGRSRGVRARLFIKNESLSMWLLDVEKWKQRNSIVPAKMVSISSRCFSSTSTSTPSSSPSSTTSVLEKPTEPSPSECCGNGCKDCVWESYYDKLCLYEEQQEKLSRSTTTTATTTTTTQKTE